LHLEQKVARTLLLVQARLQLLLVALTLAERNNVDGESS
jgi:hypothetical protein